MYAVASGKGGVGKSSVTVNLAAALAKRGLSVGVIDADIYGHSVPRMLGTADRPTQVEDMIMPPQAHGVKVISIGMFTSGNAAVVWRGPMLHRALQQFLADVYWGDLDVLLLDLPPGTGDMAISLAQLLPNAEILVVTTPQMAAAEVAERAGAIALQTHQRLIGVVENMSWLELPNGDRMEIFGAGGGATVAESLTRIIGAQVPLLGQVPLDTRVRESGDAGTPIVLADPAAPAAAALTAISEKLATRRESLVGKPLGLASSLALIGAAARPSRNRCARRTTGGTVTPSRRRRGARSLKLEPRASTALRRAAYPNRPIRRARRPPSFRSAHNAVRRPWLRSTRRPVRLIARDHRVNDPDKLGARPRSLSGTGAARHSVAAGNRPRPSRPGRTELAANRAAVSGCALRCARLSSFSFSLRSSLCRRCAASSSSSASRDSSERRKSRVVTSPTAMRSEAISRDRYSVSAFCSAARRRSSSIDSRSRSACRFCASRISGAA